MLETKELCKIYRPKKGVPVTALDHINIKFPKTGMVFLLGKSGSGKSTLLNLLGGLDKYDGGEIIIKGVSSKDFKQQHFDSYRNTYVGFIFQEYNVLDEFNVGANIALAIELQNRKATDEQINDILNQVDLEGFGDRKPNELSGGQKQRVAIARALVKNPDIIMADEPTGALDSATGRQVFDTLKKLSADKLVIVVSHDREFAEQYADRIIELSDGQIISDVEYNAAASENACQKELSYDGNTVSVPAGYHLTENDRDAINQYILTLKDGALLKISGGKSKRKFLPTVESVIEAEDSSKFKLIKSKLPLKNAFKIGAGGLKYKKVRLVFTILLSCVAFDLFGLSDTFGAYNHIKTCTNSIVDSKIDYASVVKSKKVEQNGYSYWRNYGYRLTDNDLKDIKTNTGDDMIGIYTPNNVSLEFSNNYNPETKFSETDYHIYSRSFNGFAEMNQTILDEFGYKVTAGKLPDGSKDEIAISAYLFETFKKGGYSDGTVTTGADGKTTVNYQKISGYSDMIGKSLTVAGKKYTVTAVIDTGFDLDRYLDLTEKKEHQSTADSLINYALANEFSAASNYSLANVIMVGDGYLSALLSAKPPIVPIANGYVYYWNDSLNIDPQFMAKLSDIKSQKITWLNGEKTTLSDREIIITTDMIQADKEGNMTYTEDGLPDYAAMLQKNSTVRMNGFDYSTLAQIDSDGYNIVGIIPIDEKNQGYARTVICNDSMVSAYTDGCDGSYNFAVGPMPEGKEDIQKLVAYCYRQDSPLRYEMQNSVTYELDTINDVLKSLSKVFLYIGIGFAVFAALMLANFIGSSISHKKQEIGILRAIGSRSNDVFRIFFAESFIIAMINFVLSGIGVFAATMIINYMIRSRLGVLITVLNFGPRQIALLLLVSIAVAFLASFLPVKKIASKRPIDAIRDR